MLDIGVEECQQLKLAFNDKKSSYIIMGPTFNVAMNNSDNLSPAIAELRRSNIWEFSNSRIV